MSYAHDGYLYYGGFYRIPDIMAVRNYDGYMAVFMGYQVYNGCYVTVFMGYQV